MKNSIVLFFLAMFALLLPACVGYVDGNNRPFAVGMQPIEAGTFGPHHPYQSITNRRDQHVLVQGRMILDAGCISGQPQIHGGYRVNQVPTMHQYHRSPMPYLQPQPCPENFGYGGGYGYGYGQQYQPQQPPVYRYYQNTNNSATATTGSGARLQPGRYNPQTRRWE